MGAGSLGWLSGREESSMKESAKVPGRNAGLICRVAGRVLLANAENSSAIFWCRGPSHPDVGRRLVECYRLGLPMKSLGNRCRRTSDGVDDCTDGGVCAFLSKSGKGEQRRLQL